MGRGRERSRAAIVGGSGSPPRPLAEVSCDNCESGNCLKKSSSARSASRPHRQQSARGMLLLLCVACRSNQAQDRKHVALCPRGDLLTCTPLPVLPLASSVFPSLCMHICITLEQDCNLVKNGSNAALSPTLAVNSCRALGNATSTPQNGLVQYTQMISTVDPFFM